MKIYINNRNYLTWPKAIVDRMQSDGHEVFIIDQNSSYEPLLDYYETKPCEVIKLHGNYGHRSPWEMNVVDTSDFYVVTDPDLDLSQVPSDWEEVLREGLLQYGQWYGPKCGLSIKDTGIPKSSPMYSSDWYQGPKFCDHPDGLPQFWEKELPGNFFAHPVDTTFALYAPGTSKHFDNGGVRSGKPYTAVHLPWHLVLDEDLSDESLQVIYNDEIHYYMKEANAWSIPGIYETCSTRVKIAKMINEYERRLK